MALPRKRLLPIKVGHTKLGAMLGKQNKSSGFVAKSLRLFLRCGFFPFQVILMNGSEGCFATSYRKFLNGVFMDFCMKKIVLLCDEPCWEFRLLLTFLPRGYSCPVSTC